MAGAWGTCTWADRLLPQPVSTAKTGNHRAAPVKRLSLGKARKLQIAVREPCQYDPVISDGSIAYSGSMMDQSAFSSERLAQLALH